MTLVTLAADLGVSRATVSNAYNRPDQLSPALRAKILARATELGFAGPDPLARGLLRGRVGAVGVLVDQSLSYAFSDPATVLFLDGLARELQSDGIGLLLHAGQAGREELENVRDASVDAWVVQSLSDDHPSIAAAQARNRPMIVLDQPRLPGVAFIGVDDRAGGRLALEHLLGLGHTRLGLVSMPLRPDGTHGPAGPARQKAVTYQVMRHRLAGAREAVEAAGLRWNDVAVVECASNDVDAGVWATDQLMAVDDPPTAVFALSDQLALGALQFAKAAMFTVPDDLSVIGFDDSPLSQTSDPPLTTVAQPLLERGQAAGVLVRALLRGETPDAPPIFPVHLVVRSSTGPARQ